MRFQHSIAVIIGINNYQSGLSPLKTPVCDAETIAKVLQTRHGYKTHLFLDEQAQRPALIELLEEKLPTWIGLCGEPSSSANSRLLFYFAGHGIALNGDDGPEGYLIPQDARLGDVSTYLSMPRVHDALNRLACRHFLGILDCCFAGSFRWASTRKAMTVETNVIHKERFDRFIQDPAWQIVTSSAYDQTALDSFSLRPEQRGQPSQNSPFASALIEALRGKADAYPPAAGDVPAGDGVITGTELYQYVRDRVELATEASGLRQTPGLHPMKKHDKGEFIFLTPGHKLNLPPAPSLDASQNPYRGLQSFELEHSALFFGRRELTDQLHTFINDHPLTVVQGASGSGKSSLIKAGLIPKLKQSTEEHWTVLSTIRPGERPFQALNAALSEANLPVVELPVMELPVMELQTSEHTLTRSIAAWSQQNPEQKLLLFIDQSEELITLCLSENHRQAFFQQILTAIDAHRENLRIVLSLRSDFEPQVREAGLKFAPAAFSKLGESVLKTRWQQGRFLVPMMTRAELRDVIEKPAEARVMHFQPHDLVDRLIDEVADMPGALPLLSFALSELYLKYLKRQQKSQIKGNLIDRALTQADYEELGGVIQSLTQRANQEYDALVSEEPNYAQVIRHVMLRMVSQGGGELARRRVPLSEIEYTPEKNRLAQTVIERFSTARLLIQGQTVDNVPYVEPAHDALVRGWDKLQTWLSQEKDLSLQRRLTPSAQEWKENQQTEFLWHANPYLDVLNKQILNSPNNNWLNKIETQFVNHSIRKKSNNQRRFIASVAGVVLALSGFSLVAGYQWRQATIGQIEALTESSKANFTVNRHSFSALLDALTAVEILQRLPFAHTQRDIQTEAIETLTKAVYWVRQENQLLDHTDTVQIVRYSPDGTMMATGGYDNSIKLWTQDGSLIKTLEEHNNAVASIDFSPDSQSFVSVDSYGTLRLWDRSGQPIWEKADAHDDWVVVDVSFSPDGKVLATAGKDGKVKLWNVQDHRMIDTLSDAHQKPVRKVRFSPSNDRIITVSEDATAKLWSQDGKTLIKSLDKHADAVTSVEFAPNGEFFVTASEDSTVRIWNPEGEQVVPQFTHSEPLWSVSISPDGKTIAAGGNDGTVILLTQEGQFLDSWIGHEGGIPSLSFSSDGETLTTVGNDSAVKHWQVKRNRLTILAGGQEDSIENAKFSPNGKQIVVASDDGYIRSWDRTGNLLFEQLAHDEGVHRVIFSPDGNLIASGGADDSVKIWDATGNLQQTFSIQQEENNSIWAINFSSDGNMVAAASTAGIAQIWDLEGTELAKLVDQQQGLLWSVAFSPDGKTIATGGDDTSVRLWNLEGQELRSLEHYDTTAIEFSPDGHTILTASLDGTIKLWDSKDNKLLETLEGDTADVFGASFSPNGRMIASASSDRTVKLWRTDGTLITTLRGHNGSVNSVHFSSNSEWLVSSGEDGKTVLWNVAAINLEDLMTEGCNHIQNYLRTQPKDLSQLCR